jgi:hypothetical protein
MDSQVVSGRETDKGDIYIEYLIAEGDVFNKSIVNGLPLGYTSDLLQRWHDSKSWIGTVQNAHPTKNHPLAFTPYPPMGLGESGEVDWFRARSADWGFANYISTKIKMLSDGRKQLFGTIHLTNEDAKRAWREGKYPKYSSSSVYIKNRTYDGMVTDGIPIAATCVEKPAYPLDVAGIHNECHGGTECVHKIAESGFNCQQCKHEILTSFENYFSSNSKQKVSESSMSQESSGSTPGSESSTKPDVTPALIQSEETKNAEGKVTETKETEQEIDWKAKYEDTEKARKKLEKEHNDYKTSTDERIGKIEKDRLTTKVRSIIDKIPMFAFDGKEEVKEEAIKKYVKRYPTQTEDAIIEDINDKYLLVMKVEKVRKVGESGISNDAKLNPSDSDKPDPRILSAHLVGN